MVALTITAVGLKADAKTSIVQFGEAVAVGNCVYKAIASDDKWFKALSDTAIHAGQDGIAIAVHAVEDDLQYGQIVTSGGIFLIGGLTKGLIYIVGDGAAGDIDPSADSGSGDFVTILGIAGVLGAGTTNSDDFTLKPQVSNLAVT